MKTSSFALKRIFLYSFFLSNYAVASTDDVVNKRNFLRFDGRIDLASANLITNALRSGTTTILINSEGGDAKAGLLIGKEMLKHPVTVIVNKYCFSSCANYLFLSAHRKALLPGAVLGFHGGITGKSPLAKVTSPAFAKVKRQMNAFFGEDEKHFKSLAIDKRLIELSYELTKPTENTISYELKTTEKTYSELSEPEAEKIIANAIERNQLESVDITIHNASRNKAYFPSRSTLQKYGVKGILNYPYPKDKDEMTMMLKDEFNGELELVGDFN